MITNVYHYQRQLLVVETDTQGSADVLQQALRAERVFESTIAVQHNYENVVQLRRLGYTGYIPGLFAPSSFASVFRTLISPFSHQYETAEFLSSAFRGYCFTLS